MKQQEFVLEKLRTLRYKHIPAKSIKLQSKENLCYAYIGNNHQHFSQTITGFKTNYYYDNFISALKLFSQVETSGSLPDVILFDGTFSEREINYYLQTLHNEYGKENIIAIAEVSGCTKQQINILKHSKLIDDLICIEASGEALECKVKFLQKVKSVQDPAVLLEKLELIVPKKNTFYCYSKRFIEFILSVTLLILLSPVLLLIALAIKLESKGPVFYIAPRAGKGYKIFNFYKFRTMVVDADKKVDELSGLNLYAGSENGPVFFKADNDPRITRVGTFLRNTSLDELLQLYNVALGNMSFVGNRPLPLYEAATLTTDEYAARFMAPAGITGLWQIKKRGCSNMSVEERINLDIDYAKKNSLVYDLWIIANTPSALFQKTNV